MKNLRAHYWGLAVCLIAGASPVRAQVKFADFTPGPENNSQIQNVSFEDAKAKADLKHGTLVSLNLSDGTKVTGHVVRFDPKTNHLFLRTRPGEAPIGFAEGDIVKMAKATRPGDPAPVVGAAYGVNQWQDLPGGLQENSDGTIRIKPRTAPAILPAAREGRDLNQIKPAVDEAANPRQNVVEPEIIRQVYYNGTQRTVVYHSSVLSPGEREILDQMEKAENELAAVTHQKDMRDSVVALDTAMQVERLRNQVLVNQTMQNENYVNYPYPLVPPGIFLTPAGWREKGVITLLPQTVVSPAANTTERTPTTVVDAAKTRDELARLRSQAVFEDGRLVAVDPKSWPMWSTK